MKTAPSYKNAPSAINEAAWDVWRWVVKHYADDIYESKSMRDQWRKAKSHFERTCVKRGVPPYAPYAPSSILRGFVRGAEPSLITLAARLNRLARSL